MTTPLTHGAAMDLSAPQLAAALVPTFPPDAPNSAEPDDLLPDDDALDAEFANDDEREQRRSTSLRIKQLRTAMRDRIPARLKEARKMNGLDLETAARYLGVTRAVLMGFEAGRRTVPGATCVAAAEQYAVSLDYLLGVSDEPERDPGGTIARQMREGARMLVERMSSAVIASTIRHGQQLSAVFDDAESLSSAADRTLRALERVRELNPEWQDMRGGATLEGKGAQAGGGAPQGIRTPTDRGDQGFGRRYARRSGNRRRDRRLWGSDGTGCLSKSGKREHRAASRAARCSHEPTDHTQPYDHGPARQSARSRATHRTEAGRRRPNCWPGRQGWARRDLGA